jgi:hypothetical protein
MIDLPFVDISIGPSRSSVEGVRGLEILPVGHRQSAMRTVDL